jgi:hypothetical protein
VFVPWGTDIQTWQQATLLRNEVRAANTRTALEALAVGGLVVGSASNDRGVQAAGGMVAVTGLTGLVAQGYSERVEAAQRSPIFPESHLLAVPFGVPPGLFTKKWLVLNTLPTSRGCVRSVLLDYEIDRGVRERAWLTFRKRASRSQWQRAACSG